MGDIPYRSPDEQGKPVFSAHDHETVQAADAFLASLKDAAFPADSENAKAVFREIWCSISDCIAQAVASQCALDIGNHVDVARSAKAMKFIIAIMTELDPCTDS